MGFFSIHITKIAILWMLLYSVQLENVLLSDKIGFSAQNSAVMLPLKSILLCQSVVWGCTELASSLIEQSMDGGIKFVLLKNSNY